MSFHDIVPPDQLQYRVDGHQRASAAVGLASVPSSDKSLQIKPDKHGYAPQPQTQSRTDGSEQASLRQHLEEAAARAAKQEHQRAKQIELKGRNGDALDEAIEQERAVGDLVIRSPPSHGESQTLTAGTACGL